MVRGFWKHGQVGRGARSLCNVTEPGCALLYSPPDTRVEGRVSGESMVLKRIKDGPLIVRRPQRAARRYPENGAR